MKRYSISPNIVIRVIIAVIGILGTLSLYFDELFPWSTGMFFGSVLLFFAIAFFSPLRYFCGVVALCIDDQFIVKKWLGIKVHTLERENAFVFGRIICGVYFYVFSQTDLRQAKTPTLLWQLITRKAMVYPYDPAIRSDFPEMFA